jgi:hypothetical protein
MRQIYSQSFLVGVVKEVEEESELADYDVTRHASAMVLPTARVAYPSHRPTTVSTPALRPSMIIPLIFLHLRCRHSFTAFISVFLFAIMCTANASISLIQHALTMYTYSKLHIFKHCCRNPSSTVLYVCVRTTGDVEWFTASAVLGYVMILRNGPPNSKPKRFSVSTKQCAIPVRCSLYTQ